MLLSACASKAEFTALETRVVRLEQSRGGVQARLKRDQHRLKRLLNEVEESTGFLRASGAELTARIDQLDDRLRKARGELEVISHGMALIGRNTKVGATSIDTLRRRLDRLIADLRDRAGITILALPRDLPESATDWVKLAQDHFEYGEIRTSEAVAMECAKRFAGTRTAGECAVIQARIAYEEHRFADALKVLQTVHDGLNARAFPIVGIALLRISEVLQAQGKCQRSAEVLKYLRAEMSKLAQARQAKVRLAELRTTCKEGVQTLPERSSGTRKRPSPAPTALPAGGTATNGP